MSQRLFDPSRTPSYCDRIITSPEWEVLWVDVNEGVENGQIRESDHSAVAGMVRLAKTDLTILVITWNGAELQLDAKMIRQDWLQWLTDRIDPLIPVGALWITTQELEPPQIRILGSVVSQLLFRNYTMHTTMYSAATNPEDTVSGFFATNLRPSYMEPRIRCLENITPAKTAVCSKAAVSLLVRWPFGVTVTLIGTHLPLDTNRKPDYGIEHRVKVWEQLLTEQNGPVIVAGDLNFRVSNGQDQLREWLGSQSKWSESRGLPRFHTCKTVPVNRN